MKILGLHISRKAPAPSTHVYVSVEPGPDKTLLASRGLRPAMWVKTPDGIGVVKGIDPHFIVGVALVNEDGTNRLDMFYPIVTIRQARFAEIPAARRPSEHRGMMMGYL